MSKSIYEVIGDYLDSLEINDDEDVKLGEVFRLPREDDGKPGFVDGGLDGVIIYHMGSSELENTDIDEIGAAINLAGAGDWDKADGAIKKVCNRIRVVNMIDEMQHYIVDHSAELDASNIYNYALHLMLESPDIESVKAGMMMLELFDVDVDVKDVVRILGLSDEFTLYAVFLMRVWEDGQTEIMNLAKKVEGWGKIHAVHFIEPETDEIKYWLLTGAVSNYVMPAYSGLDCFEKADVMPLLDKKELSYEEIEGILAIVDAMLDEGPVPGISEIEDPEAMLVKVLNHACKHLPLKPWDCEAVNNISDWQEENGDDDNPDIEVDVDKILGDPETRELIIEEVKKGKHIYLAKSIGLPYKEELFTAMEGNFEELYSSCRWLMKDDKYAKDVVELFRKNMDLKNLDLDPENIYGLDEPDANKLDFIVQELKNKQGLGDDFVEAALRSPVIRNRNCALNVIEAWVENLAKPLKVASSEFYKILTELVNAEPEEKVKARMEALLAGNIKFDDED